jgi:hypothetical protein
MVRGRQSIDSKTLQGGPKHTGGALTKSSPTRRFPSFFGLGLDATVSSTRFTGLRHQGHPASRKYSGGEPATAILSLVAQSSRTVSVTTPPEIIPYYRLNHSFWSLSDNKEVSRWVLPGLHPVNHLTSQRGSNVCIKTPTKESPECLTN